MGKKSTWELKLKELGWPEHFGFDFGVNRWGSCQYASALAVYDLYFSMRMNLTRETTLKLLGISFKPKKLHYKVDGVGLKNQIDSKYNDAEYADEQFKKIFKGKESVTFDEAFKAMRNSAWDLWGAAPMLFGLAFEGAALKGVRKAGGVGPCMNVAVQSDNYAIGLQCALLQDYGVVKSEASFMDFDT